MAILLIVEDDRKTNEAICEYMKSAGHKTIPALDGAEALQKFRNNEVDLIILDIMLPKMTGLAVLHEIRRASVIPVLMLTAIEDEYTQIQSFDEQADDYITNVSQFRQKRCRIFLSRFTVRITPGTVMMGGMDWDCISLIPC